MQLRCPTCGEIWRPGHPHPYATMDNADKSEGLSLQQWHDKITKLMELKKRGHLGKTSGKS